MFQRTILDRLKKWALQTHAKPLVLRGARQVGKTTVIDIFSKEFDQYIYLNLEKEADKEVFEHDYEIDDLINAIFLKKNIINNKKRTLLFIDEIQSSAEAVKSLRYFYELENSLYVVAAGSMLESVVNMQISFPVGRVEYAYMYPLTFHEFLIASNETVALDLKKSVPINEIAHNKLFQLFHRYALIGGMPEIVSAYIKDENISLLRIIYEGLKTSYMDDVEKYAKNLSQRNIIRYAIDSIPSEVGKRIKFQNFGKSNYRSREVGEALRTLEKALLIELSYPTTSVTLPSVIDKKKSPKLHFLDTGLVSYFNGLQSSMIKIDDLSGIYRGMILEHVIAQELRAIDNISNAKTKFWVREKNQSNAEVDFVIQYNKYLIPLEVKSGATGSLKSLHEYMQKTSHPYAVRLYSGKLIVNDLSTFDGKQFKLLNLPYYLVGQIYKYLEWFIENL